MREETKFKLFAVGMVFITIALGAVLAYQLKQDTERVVKKIIIPEMYQEATNENTMDN